MLVSFRLLCGSGPCIQVRRSDWLFCDKMVAKQSGPGLFPRVGEYSNVGSESGKRQTNPLRHLRCPFEAFGCSSSCPGPASRVKILVLAPALACAALRFGNLAALNLIEAHSHTPSIFLGGSNFRLANLIMAGSHFAGGQGNTKARSCRRHFKFHTHL